MLLFRRWMLLSVLLLAMVSLSVQAQDAVGRIAFSAVSDGDLWVYGLAAQPQRIAQGADGESLLPDGGKWDFFGDLLAYRRRNLRENGPFTETLLVYDRRNGTVTELFTTANGPIGLYTFTLDSTALYLVQDGAPGRLLRLNITPGAVPEPLAETGLDCPVTANTDEDQQAELLTDTLSGVFFHLRCSDEMTSGLIDIESGMVTPLAGLQRPALSVNGVWIAGTDANAESVIRWNLPENRSDSLHPQAMPEIVDIGRDGRVIYATKDAAIRQIDGAGSDTLLYDDAPPGAEIVALVLWPDLQSVVFNLQVPLLDTDTRTDLYSLDLNGNTARLIAEGVRGFSPNFVASRTVSQTLETVSYTLPADVTASLPPTAVPQVSAQPTLSPTPAATTIALDALEIPDATEPLVRSPARRQRISASSAADLTPYAWMPQPGINRVTWSPGGSVFAAVAGTVVQLYDMSDLSRPPLELTHNGTVRDLAFSPDGRSLAVSIGSFVSVWALDSGTQQAGYVLRAQQIAYSPDGQQIGFIGADGGLGVYDIGDGRETIIQPGNAGADAHLAVAFRPDGQRIAALRTTGEVVVYDTLNLQSVQTLTPAGAAAGSPAQPAEHLAYSDNGRFIAAASGESLSVWDARQGSPLPGFELPQGTSEVASLEINTRAGLILAVFNDGSAYGQQVGVWQLASGARLLFARHPGAESAAFSPDSTLIATAGGRAIRLWSLPDALPSPEQAREYSSANILAACDRFNAAPTGLVEGQSISLVWSWYAATEALVQDHLDAVQFTARMNDAPLYRWIYLTQTVDDPVNDGNPTVYFYMPVGRPAADTYNALVDVTWVEPISDGFADFGPGTVNLSDTGTCSFVIR